jgi:hypothetical protein
MVVGGKFQIFKNKFRAEVDVLLTYEVGKEKLQIP